MSDTYFGMLGSMVFAGQAFGSFIASPVLQKAPPKYVLIICLMINVASLIVFTLTNIIAILCVVRCITGIMQVFFTIFMPVWVDAFGNEEE
jgi:predicted MFS family arabinose efflux permease